MASNITDLLDRVTDSNSARPIIATLASPGKAIGASSLNLAAATNWTTETALHFSIYETTTVGNLTVKDATTQTDWKGTLSGVAIGNLTLTGGTDRAYTAGAIVEITPTSRYAKDLYDWAIVGHNQNGTHKAFTESSIVPTAAIQDSAVTTAKVNDAAITPAKRAGGFKVGTIAASTFATTGVKSITGVGFTPKLVRFKILPPASTTSSASGSGAMDATSQYFEYTSSQGSNFARDSGTTACIVARLGGTNTAFFTASFSAFGADGFSINVTTADSGAFSVAYEAYA